MMTMRMTDIITFSDTTISGAPGDTRTITVSNPAGVLVQLSSPSNDFPQSNFSPATGTATSFTSTVTLPSTDGTYTIFAVGTIGGTTVSDTATVTVETTALGTLSITTVGKDGEWTHKPLRLPSEMPRHCPKQYFAFSVTLTGPGISRTVDTLTTG